MTDTPLPFEEEVEKILERVQLYAKDSPMKVSGIDNIDRAEAKAALLAAHKKEMRRVIGEAKPSYKDQLGQSTLEDEGRCRFYRYGGYNFAVDEYEKTLYKRASIEPEETTAS